MKTGTIIDVAKFKEHCLELLDDLDPEGLVITKEDGRPVARLIPHPQSSKMLIGSLRDQLQIHGDIFSTGVAWDANAQS